MLQHASESVHLCTIPVLSFWSEKADLKSPKFAIGQLVETCLDQYSNSVDVLITQGIKADGEWLYYARFVACIIPGKNSPQWDTGEICNDLPERDLDPLTDADMALLESHLVAAASE